MLHDKTISHSQKIGSVTSHQKYVTGNAIIMSLKNQPITCQEISVTSIYCNVSRTKVFHTFVWKFMHVRVVRRSRYLS